MKQESKEVSVFFSGKSIGKSLREVAVDLIKTDTDDVVSRWFHSDSHTDLFTWVDQRQNIIKQQLSFHGQVVEWNCLEGIKTGCIIELDLVNSVEKKKTASSQQEETSAVTFPRSETIQFDSKPMSKAVDLALEILYHMEVEEKFRDQLIGNFKDPQYLRTMSPQAFIDRFGFAIKNFQKQDHSFWENFKRRCQHVFKK